MSSLWLESVGVSGVGHAVDLAIITGVGVAASCLDAVGFDAGFVSVNAWKDWRGGCFILFCWCCF